MSRFWLQLRGVVWGALCCTSWIPAAEGAFVENVVLSAQDEAIRANIPVAIEHGLALVGTYSGKAHLFQTQTGSLIKSLALPLPFPEPVRDVALYDRYAVVGTYSATYVYDVDSLELLHELPGIGISSNHGISIDDGRVLLASRTSYVYDLSSGERVGGINSRADSVALNGDYAVLGSSGNGFGGRSRVWICDWRTGAFLHDLSTDETATDTDFGLSVASDGDVVVVGAINDPRSIGSAHVFDLLTGELQHRLRGEYTTSGSFFGFDVLVHGDTVFVGAQKQFNPALIGVVPVSQGLVYAFSATTGNVVAQLTAPFVNGRFDYDGRQLITAQNQGGLATVTNFVIPEPGTVVLMVGGLIGCMLVPRPRRTVA